MQALHSSLLPSSLECLTMLLNNQEASLTNMARCQESTLVFCNRQESVSVCLNSSLSRMSFGRHLTLVSYWHSLAPFILLENLLLRGVVVDANLITGEQEVTLHLEITG